MPENFLRSALGDAVHAGARDGRALFASPSLPTLYLVVAEEPTQRVLVTVTPRFDAGVGLRAAEPAPEPGEVERLRAALDAAVVKLRESEAREVAARREVDTLRAALKRATGSSRPAV